MRFLLSTPIAGSIDADNGIIRGVSVISEGPALGHGVMIDAVTLSTTKEAAETYRGGLKVKMNHYSGADAIVGRLVNFAIDGSQLRADLTLLRTSPHRELLLEMATTMPESFGLSISFSGSVDEDEDGQKFARCLEIYSCDIVDQPAANPTGLFSVPIVDNPTKAMSEQIIAELTAKHQVAAEQAQTNFAALQAKTLELDALKAAFDAQAADLVTLRTAAVEAKTKLEQYEAGEAERINAEAARTVAANGHPQLSIGSDSATASTKTLLEQFEAIQDKEARFAFYLANKDALLAGN